MATMKTISAALKLVDAKKEKLRKAFEDLQSHSSSLSSFTLTWSDLDSHFTSLHSSLEHRFKLLQSQPQSHPSPKPQPPSSSATIAKDSSDSGFALARPELKSFCEKMDGLGLRKYIVDRPKERSVIRVELPDALRRARDAPAMVLDAMEGFYKPGLEGDKNVKVGGVRRSCVALLEGLLGLKPEITAEVKARAMNLAVEWKKAANTNEESMMEALGFLHLLATYGLVDGFNREELLDYASAVVKYKQSIKLYRVLGFTDVIPDLIRKLIGQGKQLLAVKFIFEFKLTDKFPPVPLLKDYVNEANKLAHKVRKGKKNSLQLMNEATMQETGALKSVIKVIEDHNLESEYPKESIVERIEKLEEEKARRKRPTAAPAPKPWQQSKQQKQSGGNKRPRTTASAGPAAIPNSVAAGNSSVPPFQQPNLQLAGLLPDYRAPNYNGPAGPYGLVGSNLAVAPFPASSAGLYGFSGSSFGIPGNLPPGGSHQYPSESHMPPGYYDRPVAYGGYGLPPQYHPSYHPQ